MINNLDDEIVDGAESQSFLPGLVDGHGDKSDITERGLHRTVHFPRFHFGRDTVVVITPSPSIVLPAAPTLLVIALLF